MVGVAQLVEPRIVIPVVVGSSPIIHPILCKRVSIWMPFFLPAIGLRGILIMCNLFACCEKRENSFGPLAQLGEWRVRSHERPAG